MLLFRINFWNKTQKNANNLRNCCIWFYLKMDHATDLKQGQPACLTCRLALLTCRSDGPMGHPARPTEPSRTTTTTVLQDSRTQTQSQILVPSRQRMENKVEYVVEKKIIETGSETSLWPSLLICLSYFLKGSAVLLPWSYRMFHLSTLAPQTKFIFKLKDSLLWSSPFFMQTSILGRWHTQVSHNTLHLHHLHQHPAGEHQEKIISIHYVWWWSN